jgi:hypothetical protein
MNRQDPEKGYFKVVLRQHKVDFTLAFFTGNRLLCSGMLLFLHQ